MVKFNVGDLVVRVNREGEPVSTPVKIKLVDEKSANDGTVFYKLDIPHFNVWVQEHELVMAN